MLKKTLLSIGLITPFLLSAITSNTKLQYTNCNFKEKKYERVCNELKKEKININYINKFLLLPKNKKVDYVTLKLFEPKKIKMHKKNEKRANNTLVKHIPTIYKHLIKYKKVYDKVEKKYNVNREIIAAILTKETWLGKIKPKHDAWVVFNTLYLKIEPDSKRNNRLKKMGKNNMKHIIRYCYKNKVEPYNCNFKSSYAGAVGIPQFMPMNFWLIKSFEKGKRGDLNKMEDAIMSAGNFLNKNAKFKKLINWNKMPKIETIENEWYNFLFKQNSVSYFKKENKKNIYMLLKGNKHKNIEYLNKYLKKILRYNNSINYAMGVLRIGQELNLYKKMAEKKN